MEYGRDVVNALAANGWSGKTLEAHRRTRDATLRRLLAAVRAAIRKKGT